MTNPPPLLGRCFAETLGTFLLVFFGCGAVHASVLYGAQSGLWQVAIVWGFAVTVAIYCIGGISGAHINPAITISLAAWGRFSWRDVVPYVASQLVGAFAAAAALFVIFGPALAEVEAKLGITRGQPASVATAMCYGEFYSSPGRLHVPLENREASVEIILETHWARYDELRAFVTEVLATAILALVVFALTYPGNASAAHAPVFIGITVALLISVVAPMTQACLNPARDFGPRLFTYFAGWGDAALPGPNGRGFFTVYILAPIVGACLGGGVFEMLMKPLVPPSQMARGNQE